MTDQKASGAGQATAIPVQARDRSPGPYCHGPRLAILLLMLAALFTPSWLAAQAQTAGVRLDGREVMRVGGAEDVPATTRARRIEDRLRRLSGRDGSAPRAQISSSPDGGQIVSVAGAPVVTVSTADAEDNLSTPAALAQAWAGAIDKALEDSRRRQSSWGGRFRAEVMGSIQTAFGRSLESGVAIVPRALAALLVVFTFWLAATGVRAFLRLILPRLMRDRTLQSLVRQVAFVAIVTLGLAIAADALGFSPGSVATGLGLTGLVLGFALKDILSNFVSGVLILALRPFELGDQIMIGADTEGTVERIELRATQVRTYDGRLTLVPNAEVFTSRITNNTADPVRRGNAILRLGYETDLARVAALLPAAVSKAEGVLGSPPPRVRVSELGASDVTMNVAFWTDSRSTDFQDTASAVRVALVEALRAAGVGLPNPDIRILKSLDAEAEVPPPLR